MLTVFPISNRVTDQVIMINSVITIIINNIIISITVIFAVFIADEEDEGREAYLCASFNHASREADYNILERVLGGHFYYFFNLRKSIKQFSTFKIYRAISRI